MVPNLQIESWELANWLGGYEAAKLDLMIEQAFRTLEIRRRGQSGAHSDGRKIKKIFFVQKFSSSLNLRDVRSMFNLIRPILADHDAAPLLANRVQFNIFRTLYRANWLRTS